jgi:hypothetical protein
VIEVLAIEASNLGVLVVDRLRQRGEGEGEVIVNKVGVVGVGDIK